MAFSYSGDPKSSPLDELRFIVQDTDSEFPLLNDAELTFLIDLWMPRYDSITFVGAVAAEVISRKFAGVVNVSADGVSVDTSSLADRYHTVATQLRDEYKLAQVGGVVNIESIMISSQPDYSIKPLRFGVGLHDSPLVGNQDYGTWTYNPFDMEDVLTGLWG